MMDERNVNLQTNVTAIDARKHAEQLVAALLTVEGWSAAEKREALSTLKLFAATWAGPNETPHFSGIGGDCSPFEPSMAFEGSATGVRVMVEAQAPSQNAASYWRAGNEMTHALVQRYGLSDDTYANAAPFFRPEVSTSFCAMWHALRFRRNSPPQIRIYFNPRARGDDMGAESIVGALDRVGLNRGRQIVAALLADGHVPAGFSVDLDPEVSTKVYLAHPRGRAEDLARLAERLEDPVSADLIEFYKGLAESLGPFDHRPVITCFTMRRGVDDGRPTQFTVQLPAHHRQEERMVRERVREMLEGYQLDRAKYDRAIEAIDEYKSVRHSGVSLQHHGGQRRMTVYFAPCLNEDILSAETREQIWERWTHSYRGFDSP